jgi:hypothetical protein
MAKKPQSATASEQAPPLAGDSAAQSESPALTENSPSPQMEPPPEEKKAPAEKDRKSFVAVFNIVDGAKTYAPGQTATLTRAQFETLKALGAIEGDWD